MNLKKGIINAIVKYTGANKAWELFNGKKTNIAGAGLILAGAAQIIAQLAAVDSPAGLLEILQGLDKNPGAVLILNGLGLVGLRHAVTKEAK